MYFFINDMDLVNLSHLFSISLTFSGLLRDVNKRFAIFIMGEATKDEYNPAYNHLVKLLEECNEKHAPDFVISGIQKALRLIEVCYTCHSTSK